MTDNPITPEGDLALAEMIYRSVEPLLAERAEPSIEDYLPAVQKIRSALTPSPTPCPNRGEAFALELAVNRLTKWADGNSPYVGDFAAHADAKMILAALNTSPAYPRGLVGAAKLACDLLAERTYGNAARSPGHNARVVLESALAALSTPQGTGDREGFVLVPREPTPEMALAGSMHSVDWKAAYRAIIDAALSTHAPTEGGR